MTPSLLRLIELSRIIAFISVLSLCISSTSVFAQNQFIATKHEQQVQEIESSIASINATIQARNVDLHDIALKKNSLQEEIADKEASINQLNENITQAKLVEAQLTQQIEENEKKRDELYQQMELLIPELQKESKKTGIQTVLESENIAELMRRMFGLSSFQVELENIDARLEQLNKELAESKRQQEEVRTALENSAFLLRSEQDGLKLLLEQTQGEEARYQQLISGLQSQRQQQQAEIEQLEVAYQAELDRIAAEQAAAAARANAGNTSGGSGSSGSGNSGSSGGSVVVGNCSFEDARDIGVRLQIPATGFYSQPFHCGHDGLDIANARGTPILAAYGGVVAAKGFHGGGFGNFIAIRHQGAISFTTLYAHMDTPSPLSVGSAVGQGAQIGTMGTTGYSTGYHLHFMVISGNSLSCNPQWGGGSYCFNPTRFF